MSDLSKWQWHSASWGWVASWDGYAYRIAGKMSNPPPFPVSEWARGTGAREHLSNLWTGGLYHHRDKNAGTYHIPIETDSQ